MQIVSHWDSADYCPMDIEQLEVLYLSSKFILSFLCPCVYGSLNSFLNQL